MIIDLVFASGDLRIRTRSTPAVRHAVELARAVLALGDDGHVTVRDPRRKRRLPAIESDEHYTTSAAIEEILRWTTHFETEEGLAILVRRVKRDSKLPARHRRELIRRIAPTLVVGVPE